LGKIKTRETVKNIKSLDKAKIASERMKDAFVRSKDNIQNMSDDGHTDSVEYAEDKISYMAEDTTREGLHQVGKASEYSFRKGKDLYSKHRQSRNIKDVVSEPPTSSNLVSKQTPVKEFAKKRVQNLKRSNDLAIHTTRQTNKVVKESIDTTNKAIKSSARGTVKQGVKTIKTAKNTAHTTIKTTQQAAKATAKAMKKSQKALQIARATAKATVTSTKAAAKATIASVKAIIAGTKALIAAIAAGGWVAVIAVVLICLIGLMLGSGFGIFFSGEDTGTGQSMRTAVREINTEYEERIDGIQHSTSYDKLEMSGSRAVWKEVLAIYAVKTSTDPNNPLDVATMDDERKDLLTTIFWEINDISSRMESVSHTEVTETADKDGNIITEETTVTETILYIVVSHKTFDEMANYYNFDVEQRKLLAELLEDKNDMLWSSVLYGISNGSSNIVEVALSQIGNVGGQPYWSWYGFNSRVEWCACFVSWCANESGYIDTGVIPKYAGCVWGVQWFKDRGQWTYEHIEPMAGMIIFFDWENDGITDHTGIVEKCENGIVYTIEGNSNDRCRQRQYPVGSSVIYGYGMPAY
jgi:hypothetical protein